MMLPYQNNDNDAYQWNKMSTLLDDENLHSSYNSRSLNISWHRKLSRIDEQQKMSQKSTVFALITFVLIVNVHLPSFLVHGWDNGLARTPPMGWMSWLKFACETDCKIYPKQCINENLYRDMLDRLEEDGYRELGYETVNIDDCWERKWRDSKTKQLTADENRFPSGIPALSEYAHSKKLLLGIYSDVGTYTCGGYPGTRDDNGTDYTYIDAETFSDWKVDSLKLDGCNQKGLFNITYPEFSKALAQQKHPIVYACSWPAYLTNVSAEVYAVIQQYCNYWRNFDDIMDSWESVESIIEFYGNNVNLFSQFHGPGGWFDPDMLTIGNEGLSYEQSKTQMAFWCIWSAPLMMSNDLRTIKPEFKAILQNKHLIAINQDPQGNMGYVMENTKTNKVWVKKLSPDSKGSILYAVLYFNNNQIGPPAIMSYKLSSLIPELNTNVKYNVLDLYDDNAQIATLTANQNLTLTVPTSGSVRIVKLVPN